MAKRGEVNSFEKITNDEDFEKFLEKSALLILDVYQDEFGPCSMSLHSTLERAKLSLMDSSKIMLAVCDVDQIEKLKRFRKKSIPTIVFCNRGRVIDIVYGAYIPLIKETIERLLVFVSRVPGRDSKRDSRASGFYDFDEPLPFEIAEISRKQSIKEKAEQAERERTRVERLQLNDKVIELMSENAPEAGVTIFMPHVMDSALKKTADMAKRVGLVTRGRKLVKITPAILEMLEYQLENPIEEDVLAYLDNKDVLVVLWLGDPGTVAHEELARYIEKVTELTPVVIEDEDGNPKTIEIKLLEPLLIYIEQDRRTRVSFDDVETQENENSTRPEIEETRLSKRQSLTSRASQWSRRSTKTARPLLIIPPVWTPANAAGNAMHCFAFFRKQFDSFLPPAAEPAPPHICMVFPAARYSDILETANHFPKELLEFGFFNGNQLSNMELVCKKPKEYDDLKKKPEKMVLKVAKRTSHFSLALSSMDLQYVSHNPEKGAVDCAMLFNEAFYAKEEEKKGKK